MGTHSRRSVKIMIFDRGAENFGNRTSPVFPRVNTIRILQRNLAECNNNAILERNPSDRDRFNEPAEMIAREPTGLDLSEIMKSLSNDFENTSRNLKSLAEVLKQDKKHTDSNLAENQRRDIQNNLDTVRYCSPHLINFSKIVVPIGNPYEKLQVHD